MTVWSFLTVSLVGSTVSPSMATVTTLAEPSVVTVKAVAAAVVEESGSL